MLLMTSRFILRMFQVDLEQIVSPRSQYWMNRRKINMETHHQLWKSDHIVTLTNEFSQKHIFHTSNSYESKCCVQHCTSKPLMFHTHKHKKVVSYSVILYYVLYLLQYKTFVLSIQCKWKITDVCDCYYKAIFSLFMKGFTSDDGWYKIETKVHFDTLHSH